MSLSSESDFVFRPLKFDEKYTRLNAITTDQRLLSFDLIEMKELDKGKGVQIVRLSNGNTIRDISISQNDEIPVLILNHNKILDYIQLIDDLPTQNTTNIGSSYHASHNSNTNRINQE